MFENAEIETGKERVVQLVSSAVSWGDDGSVEVSLHPEAEAWSPETGLRLTEDDALSLVDALRRAAETVTGREPQAFIRLLEARE
jgi:hypothetical protein